MSENTTPRRSGCSWLGWKASPWATESPGRSPWCWTRRPLPATRWSLGTCFTASMWRDCSAGKDGGVQVGSVSQVLYSQASGYWLFVDAVNRYLIPGCVKCFVDAGNRPPYLRVCEVFIYTMNRPHYLRVCELFCWCREHSTMMSSWYSKHDQFGEDEVLTSGGLLKEKSF